jgi:RNA polymerase sigma-70 factor (ECF subfamily)
MSSASDAETDSRKRLMALMTRHQRQIFAYIYTLVPDRHDAEDLLQETSLVVCEKFGEFRAGTDFVAWACQIAWWRIRYSRQKFARAKVVFDDVVLAAVAQTAGCLKKLAPRDRELVLTRYEPGSGVAEAARRSGRSMDAAYKALNRLRKLLHDCVTNQLAHEPGGAA